MTWRDHYAQIIHEATKELPADMPLKERMKTVDESRPGFGGTSWPKKAWQAARRDYLVRYGYVPRTKAQKDRERAVTEPLPLFERGVK